MNKNTAPSKTKKLSPSKKVTVKTVASEKPSRASRSGRTKITATKKEVNAAGDKIMKKYNVAIKKLADR